jgi:hypothetical protein
MVVVHGPWFFWHRHQKQGCYRTVYRRLIMGVSGIGPKSLQSVHLHLNLNTDQNQPLLRWDQTMV